MRKIILIVFIFTTTQTPAQINNINWCDSIVVTGSQAGPIRFDISPSLFTNINDSLTWQIIANEITWITWTGSYVHLAFNYNPQTNLHHDTITACVSFVLLSQKGTTNKSDSINCCVDFCWNGASWVRILHITSVEEITSKVIDNNMYDLYGRKIIAPKGVYIKNKKLYMR